MVHTPNGIPLRGSAFVVTGGASGLGRAAAEHLAKQGAKVALWDMNEDNGAEAVEAIGKDRAMFARWTSPARRASRARSRRPSSASAASAAW